MRNSLILVLTCFLCSHVGFSQQTLFKGDVPIENWFSCDTSLIKLAQTDGLIEAEIHKGYWACFGITFPSRDISKTTQLEVTLKGESETPVLTTPVMFRFKDENGIQTNDGTLPSNKSLLIGKGFQTFYTDFKNHLLSSDGAFDASKVNTLLIFIHFDSYMVEEFTGKITVKEIRLF